MRVLRNIPLQSAKIVIVAWQILTQVGAGASVGEMRAQVVGACYFMHSCDFWGLAPDHQHHLKSFVAFVGRPLLPRKVHLDGKGT